MLAKHVNGSRVQVTSGCFSFLHAPIFIFIPSQDAIAPLSPVSPLRTPHSYLRFCWSFSNRRSPPPRHVLWSSPVFFWAVSVLRCRHFASIRSCLRLPPQKPFWVVSSTNIIALELFRIPSAPPCLLQICFGSSPRLAANTLLPLDPASISCHNVNPRGFFRHSYWFGTTVARISPWESGSYSQ